MGGISDVIESSGLINLVSRASPVVATALGSPLAGMALSLIASAFGVDSKRVNDIYDAVKNDPEAEFKLRQIEYSHAQSLAAIAAQNYATEVDDRKAARLREISLRDYIPSVLAIGFLLNYAAIQFYCVTHPSSAIDVISARFQDVLIMIISYYFGSAHKQPTEGRT